VNGQISSIVPNAIGGGDGGALQIGAAGATWNTTRHDGGLDEVRLAETARSPSFMWASWMNQASNGAFATVRPLSHPLIRNEAVSAVINTSATLNASLLSTGASPCTVTVFYGTNDGALSPDGWAFTNTLADPPPEGAVSVPVSGLLSNQLYFYSFSATNAAGAFIASPSLSFKTFGPPRLDNTPGAASITYHAALLQGSLLDGVSASVYAAWGEAPASLTNTTGPLAAGEGLFGLPLAGLADNTAYFYRCYGTNDFGAAWADSVAAFTTLNAQLVWTGGAVSNSNASNPTNWSTGLRPIDGANIRLDATSSKNLTWDLTNVVLQSWEQTAAYTGLVVITTRYPGQGSFSNLLIAGDCTIAGGAWTHPSNTGVDTPADRMKVTVNGNFLLGSGASIQLLGRGFASARGPGAGNNLQRSAIAFGASHGGRGGIGALAAPARSYDSIVAPTNLGSGCHAAGGGNLDLRVAGTATVNGVIGANGDAPVSNYGLNPGSAGGSISIRAGVLAGSGSISAAGAGGYYGGGGGRIALIATNAESFGSLTNVTTYGGVYSSQPRGAAGTVYRETLSQAGGRGVVTINNGNIGATTYTPIPWDFQPPALPVNDGELLRASLVLTNGGWVLVNDHLRMADLIGLPAGTILALNTHSLYLATNEHALGGGTVSSNAGRLVWADGPTTHYLAVTNDPHGSATTEQTGWYPSNTAVAISATPADGYAFARWDGDVPEPVRSNAAISLVMDDTRRIRALFASADPATRTWLGVANSTAANPTNWYPPIIPADDDRIVLDESATKLLLTYDYLYYTIQSPLSWDLNIPVGAWTQTGYVGVVTIMTRYPGQGAFTNLAVTGDVTLASGTWTHPVNTGVALEADRLCVTVDGRFTLGSGAAIDVTGRGYAAGRGPGVGNNAQRLATGVGASHGGRGAYGSSPAPCYGSITSPTNLGSGATGAGGGAVKLHVAGLAEINGSILAYGTMPSAQNPGSAGGSIWLKAASLSGTGLLDASGASGFQSGGGGRVAVMVTASNTFGNVAMRAFGGPGSDPPNNRGAAGTVYRQSTAEKTLLINNNNQAVASTNWYTELPGAIPATDDLTRTTLVLTNRAYTALTTSLTMGDLFLRTNTPALLFLKGNTLTLKARYHKDWGAPSAVTYDGGQIVWPATGTLLLIR
jgi:hypothetical protein